jgi:N-acetylglutamate synthase-like GNAT family acetyltransferase
VVSDSFIRAATDSDAPGIAELLGELGYSIETNFVRDRLALLATRPDDFVLVAERQGAVAGLVSGHVFPLFHAEAWVGRITALVVPADQRRKGIGRLLLSAAEEFARGRRANRLEVTISGSHDPSVSFLEEGGYRRVDEYFVKTRLR